MNYLNEFLTEIQTLEIRGDEYLNLNHYNQYHSDYESNLKRLQQLALSEILLLCPEQIRLQLIRFQQIHDRFQRFWRVHKKLYAAFEVNELKMTDLELQIYPLFIVRPHPATIISRQFFFDLHDAVMFKQGFFKGFEAQVQEALNSFLNYSNNQQQSNIQPLRHQLINSKADIKKYQAKHYVLAYIFECDAKGVGYPTGNKIELERIGSERIGAGKGNRFYKVFNATIGKDLNSENDLIEIGGENWRDAVIELSKDPELVKEYLQNKLL